MFNTLALQGGLGPIKISFHEVQIALIKCLTLYILEELKALIPFIKTIATVLPIAATLHSNLIKIFCINFNEIFKFSN